jgi:hypothetical protein
MSARFAFALHIARWHNNHCAGGIKRTDGLYADARIATSDNNNFAC